MSLAQTGKALGKVTELVRDQLSLRARIPARVGRPEPNGTTGESASLNVFLYEASFDPNLKNVSLEEGRRPPLWMVLKYLLTAYDEHGETDSVDAHEAMGAGLRALQEMSFLRLGSLLSADALDALSGNPEVLKITFDEAPSDLLSRLMQGPDEKYRFSMAFQVRPVMIAAGDAPEFSFLVGVDQTGPEPTEIGDAGIRIPVLPATGPVLTGLDPDRFEAAGTLTVLGEGLDAPDLSLAMGSARLPVALRQPGRLIFQLEALAAGDAISAGSHAISVVRDLGDGRSRSSNLLVGRLLPTLAGVEPVALEREPEDGPNYRAYGTVRLTGMLLGTTADQVTVALFRDGRVEAAFDHGYVHAPDQRVLELTIPRERAVRPGEYRVILRVNDQQARRSPSLELAP